MDTPNATIGDITVTVAHDRHGPPDDVERLARHIAASEGFNISDLSIVFADHATVTTLNEKHLGRTYHTDVLAFDLRDSSELKTQEIEGEIYIDLDTALERAPEFKTDFNSEVRRYLIHGLLHLMGYRDDEAERSAEMKRLENLYLGSTSR